MCAECEGSEIINTNTLPIESLTNRCFFLYVINREACGLEHGKNIFLHMKQNIFVFRGGSRGRVEGGCNPPLGSFRTCLTPRVYRFFITKIIAYCCLLLAPPPPFEKILDSPLVFIHLLLLFSRSFKGWPKECIYSHKATGRTVL